MSRTESTEMAPKSAKADGAKDEKKNVPTLGALDEDDEFEEFETEDWTDKDSMVPSGDARDAQAGAASVALDMSGSARAGGDHLWEDNWDDDDIEDDFSVALRAELEKADQANSMEP